MPDSSLITEPYGSMLLAPEVAGLLVQWHTFANRQQFCSFMHRGLGLYSQESSRTQPLGRLADTRQVSAITPDDQYWLRTDSNPRAYAAGIRHINFVSPETVFGQMAVQHYTANTAKNEGYTIDVAHHWAPPAARQWLRQALHGPNAG